MMREARDLNERGFPGNRLCSFKNVYVLIALHVKHTSTRS